MQYYTDSPRRGSIDITLATIILLVLAAVVVQAIVMATEIQGMEGHADDAGAVLPAAAAASAETEAMGR